MDEWFYKWFNSDYYLKTYSRRNVDDAKRLINNLLPKIAIDEGAFVLDAACGSGRHSLILAEKGFRVISFDLSRNLLEIAGNSAVQQNIPVNLINADMRTIQFKRKFSAIFNLFTSFGYFRTDDENFKFIENSRNFLAENGYFIFDYFNSNYVKQNLVPFSETLTDGNVITEHRSVENGRVNKEINISNKLENIKFSESVKLYDADYLISKFTQLGFKVISFYGNYDCEKFDLDSSKRFIAILRT